MKPRKILYLLLLLCCLVASGWGGTIVYPRRSTTAIVKAGEHFDVWFDADSGQTVNAVELQGPYNTVYPAIRIAIGNWEYDADSHNTYDTKIAVSVPVHAPVERYDLVLKTSTGDEKTFGGVKVIKEYKDSYYVMHISDAHRWHKYPGQIDGSADETKQSIFIAEALSVLIDVANIIDPEIWIETGDNMYNLQRNEVPVETSEWISTTWEHGVPKDWYQPNMPAFDCKGTAALNAACFAVAGNHDSPGSRFQGHALNELGTYYNKWFGLQSFNLTYGNARYLGANNGWYEYPFPEAQKTAAERFIKREGSGNLQVAFLHVNDEGEIIPFYDALAQMGAAPDIILSGHAHGGYIRNPGRIRNHPIQYLAPGIRDHDKAPFNLFKVNNSAGTFLPVGGSTAANNAVVSDYDWDTVKLTLHYAHGNDGSRTGNTATLVNRFKFDVDNAKVRFVMPKGYMYNVSNGTITQAFDGDTVHVVDVGVDVGAGSTAHVTISRVDCGEKPAP